MYIYVYIYCRSIKKLLRHIVQSCMPFGYIYEINDTVEAHSCVVDIVVKFTDEHYTTINQSTAEHFDPRVFVNCLQVEKCCERRLFIWLQSGDVINVCVNKVNTMIGCGTQAEVTLVRVGLIKNNNKGIMYT